MSYFLNLILDLTLIRKQQKSRLHWLSQLMSHWTKLYLMVNNSKYWYLETFIKSWTKHADYILFRMQERYFSQLNWEAIFRWCSFLHLKRFNLYILWQVNAELSNNCEWSITIIVIRTSGICSNTSATFFSSWNS